MEELLQLPGTARRASVESPIEIPEDALPAAGPLGPPSGVDPRVLARSKSAVVRDDREARFEGPWTEGSGLRGHVGSGYHYAGGNSGATATFELRAPAAGHYDVLVAWQPHENRGQAVPVTVETHAGRTTTRLNQRQPAEIVFDRRLGLGLGPVGRLELGKGELVTVVIGTEAAGGNAHADAVLLVPAP